MSRLRALYERFFPERELYVRSNGSVRYLTLRPEIQFVVTAAALGLVVWATAFTVRSLLSETQIAYRDQAMLDLKEAYEARIGKLQSRYRRLEAELEDSERRFDQVMGQLSGKHGQLENAAGVEVVLEGRLSALRRRLDDVTEQRDDSLTKLQELRNTTLETERRLAEAQFEADQRQAALDEFVATMENTANERDDARREVRALTRRVSELDKNIEAIRRHQSQVMAQLKEATTASLGELERILKRTGVDVNGLVQTIDQTYQGAGGPFIPILYRQPEAAEGFPINENSVATSLASLQRVNSLRIALEKLPLAKPITAAYRFSSGYGMRRHPVTGGWAMHRGIDMAAPRGTPVLAPVDGVVSYAGVQRGFGKVVKIRHSLGFETVYAHLHKIRLAKGDRVSRGDRVGDVGSTGRSTGNHLHYEIRRNRKTLNPRRFMEAGNYVF